MGDRKIMAGPAFNPAHSIRLGERINAIDTHKLSRTAFRLSVEPLDFYLTSRSK
jgi:hypothetical protein